jgi:ABC-2 type transport system permease protein
MRLRHLGAVARKEWMHIRRDPRSLGMAFAIPMVLISLYGYALTLDVDNLRAIVSDQDRSPASREFLRAVTASGYFTIVAVTERPADVEVALDAGRAQVGLVLPRGLARDLDLGRAVPVQALLDGSDATSATIALGYLEAISRRFSESLRLDQPGGDRLVVPVESRLRVWYNPELKSRNYIIPGLIAVIMMVIAALLTSLTVAREWEEGTMEQLIATPLGVPELIVGKLLPYLGIGLVDVALAVLAGTLIFRVPLRGHPLLLLGFTLLFLLGVQSLGLLISVLARSQVLASQVALTTTFLPAFLLSGFVFDIGNLPGWLQAITYVVPARYFVTALKGIFLKGLGLRPLALEAAFLALFALVVMAITLRVFRKRLEG